jgi:hypothetical protein
LEPPFVGSPGFLLTFGQVRSHDLCRAEEPKQAKLGEAAEKEARPGHKMIEPPASDLMVDMPVVSERQPNVDVRQKK